MTAPAAPLDRAVEEARKALAYRGDMETRAKWLSTALRSVLAALDADRRLEEAEVALAAFVAVCDSAPPVEFVTRIGEACDIARRYFARREGEKGKVPE